MTSDHLKDLRFPLWSFAGHVLAKAVRRDDPRLMTWLNWIDRRPNVVKFPALHQSSKKQETA